MHTRKLAKAGALLVAGFLAGCSAGSADIAQHRPVFTPDGESIVFMSNVTGDWELYRSRIDGSQVERLTEHEGWDGYADAAPDGSRLVFDRSGEGGKGPFLLDLANLTAKPLGQFRNKIAGTRFSPGGDRLVAFEEIDDKRDLWLLHATDGRKLEELTHTPDENEHDPAFSPDGKFLAFAVVLDAGSALDVMNLETRVRTRIHESDGYLYGVNWHPNGEALVFNMPDGEDQDLFLLDHDGGNLVQLTSNDFEDHLASWHPDGERIVFTSSRNGSEVVYIMRTNDRSATIVDFQFD